MLKHVLPAIGLVSLLSLSSSHASAQKDPTTQRDAKNEIGLLAGATLTPSVSTTLPDAPGASGGSISFNASFALGIDYDYRFRDTDHGSIEAGIDFLASPNDVITSGGPGNAINQYAYVFLIPELRFKARPIGPVRPFGSVGGGYARFREGKLRNGAVNPLPGTNTAAGEFTVGVDSTKEIHLKLPILGSIPIGGRLEVRDYLSGQPNYQVPTASGTQNSVAFLGGFTIKL